MPAARRIFSPPAMESLPETRERGLRIASFRKSCVDFHWHFHPEIELIHIRRGHGVRYAGKSVEPFLSGDLCLLGPNLPHAFGSSPSERDGAVWTVFHFLPEIWGADFWKLGEMRRIEELFTAAQRGIHFDTAGARDSVKDLQAIARMPKGPVRIAAWISALDGLARLPRHYLNPVSVLESATDVRLQEILAWIDANAAEPDLIQSRVATRFGQSPQAFCHFFRTRTGRAFHRYVNEVRTALACGRLLSTDKSVSEIAFESGFNNLSNFNRRFLEITGHSPRQYRRMRGGV